MCTLVPGKNLGSIPPTGVTFTKPSESTSVTIIPISSICASSIMQYSESPGIMPIRLLPLPVYFTGIYSERSLCAVSNASLQLAIQSSSQSCESTVDKTIRKPPFVYNLLTSSLKCLPLATKLGYTSKLAEAGLSVTMSPASAISCAFLTASS